MSELKKISLALEGVEKKLKEMENKGIKIPKEVVADSIEKAEQMKKMLDDNIKAAEVKKEAA